MACWEQQPKAKVREGCPGEGCGEGGNRQNRLPLESRTPAWAGLWTLSYMPSIYGNDIPTGKPGPLEESEVIQSCLTLCNPVDCNPPGSSVDGILQAKILEWVAISFSK